MEKGGLEDGYFKLLPRKEIQESKVGDMYGTSLLDREKRGVILAIERVPFA